MYQLPNEVRHVFRSLDVEEFPFVPELGSRLLLYPVVSRTLPVEFAKAVIEAGFAPDCYFAVEGSAAVEVVSMSHYSAYARRAQDEAGLVQGLAAVDASWGAIFSEEFVGLLAGRPGFAEQVRAQIGGPDDPAIRAQLAKDVEEANSRGITLMNIEKIVRHVDGAQD